MSSQDKIKGASKFILSKLNLNNSKFIDEGPEFCCWQQLKSELNFYQWNLAMFRGCAIGGCASESGGVVMEYGG